MLGAQMASKRKRPPATVEADPVPDEIPALEVERRLLTACKTIRALPDRDRKFFTVKAMWPDVVRETSDAYGYTEAMMPRFRPSPRDVSDCLVALAWARCLEKREFRFIWWRSFDLSYRAIANKIHRSHEDARRKYRDAILLCWYHANWPGVPIY